jgi:thiol-disulfide isomerase/thioredoxin
MRKWLLIALLIVLLPPPTTAGPAPELRAFVRGSWAEIRRSHTGQPTVVHMWGLTCAPCRVEMPHWGKLLEERPDLNLVMINADLVANEPTAVSALLARTGLAGAENWIFGDSFVERLRYEIDPQWQGEIPLTFLISPDGATTTIEGVADLGDIRTWLDDQTKTPSGRSTQHEGAHEGHH